MVHPELGRFKWRVAAVVGLSAVVGSEWLLTEAYPSEMAFPLAGCVHFAVIAVAGLIGSKWTGWNWRKAAGVAAAGVGLFVLPGVVGQLTAGTVSVSASVAMFCAVPLMIVLGMAWFREGSGWGLMMPSLVGLFGALLIFSVDVPHTVRRWVGLLAVLGCCALVAAASVWLCESLRGIRIAAALTVVGTAGAATLGAYGLLLSWPPVTLRAVAIEATRCVVFDLPVVWMTLWLAREMSPVRLAARFLVAPVVTWLEGYAMVRGAVELRSVVALALMAAGAAMVLVKHECDEVPGLGLR